MKIFKNTFWTIIPARKGSKRIENKNIIKINGHPLIAFSITNSIHIREIKKTLVLTNCKKIIKISKNYGAEIPYIRSNTNCKSNSIDFEYFEELVSKNQYNIFPEFLIQLRPTTPFRDTKVIRDALFTMKKNKKKFDSLRSASLCAHPPEKMFRIKNKKYCDINLKKLDEEIFNMPSHLIKKTYLPNGYVDIVKTKNILKNKLYGNRIYPFITKKIIDIDTLEDFKMAKNDQSKEKAKILKLLKNK